MATRKHLIIGAGPAALAAAESIRKVSKTDEITLISREETLPYSPVVLPYLISKELTEADLFSKGKDLLESLNINLITGKEAVEIIPQQNQVKLSTGEKVSYDKLLIATGARPQIPPVENIEPEQVYTFRTYADFVKLNKTLVGKQEIAIYGAGLVAVEAAEKLCLAGHKVTIIARSSLLRKYFSPKSVQILEQAFNQHGGQIITGKTLTSVKKAGDKIELFLSSGDKMVVDILLAAAGVTSNFVGQGQLAEAEGGIKVGKQMETNVPNVYAAGDVAAAPSFFDGGNAPCPILPEAVVQGTIAGANMAGEETSYAGWIPGNYLRCFEENLFTIGNIFNEPGNAYEVFEKTDSNGSLKLLFKGEYLVGAEGLNMKSIHPGVFLYLIREQIPVKKHQKLLLSKPREAAAWLMLQHRKSQAI